MAENSNGPRWQINLSFLEQGNIYFFYKPKRGQKNVTNWKDVGRFYFVLQPDTDTPDRYIVLGAKKLPHIDEGSSGTGWGIVQRVGGRGFRVIKTDGVRTGAARPIGEGVYAIVRHGAHTHFLYSLELPTRIGDVQQAFNLQRTANYVIVTKPARGLFSITDRRLEPSNFEKFTALIEVELLNYAGTEILLTSGSKTISSLGVSVQKDKETEETADIFSQLHVSKQRHPIEPLLYGQWR